MKKRRIFSLADRGVPPPLNGQNPLKRFWQVPLCIEEYSVLTRPRTKLLLKKSFLPRSALPTCQVKSSGDTGWRHFQWNLWPKKLKETGHSKLDRVLIWLFFRFQHTCVSYDTQLVNKIKLSLLHHYFDNGFCIYGNARCFESDDNMAMMTKPSQAKYAVSYTTINAFVPDRTPRCESVILIMACGGTDDHHQRIH